MLRSTIFDLLVARADEPRKEKPRLFNCISEQHIVIHGCAEITRVVGIGLLKVDRQGLSCGKRQFFDENAYRDPPSPCSSPASIATP